MTRALTLLLVAALAWGARAADEPGAEALAEAWLSQRFGGDAVEIWRTEWAARELVYGVARRWQTAHPEVVVRVLKPHQYTEVGFLVRERSDARTEVLYYRSPKLFPAGKKAARVMPFSKPDPLERLPFAPGLPALSLVWPGRTADYTFTRLPDADVAGQPCRRIEGRPRAADPGFDVFVAALSRETGVALDTQWLRKGNLVRRVTTAPEDVKDYDGRLVPTRLLVEVPGNESQEYRLEKLMIDAVLPDPFFATQNLKTGRFPSY